MYTHKHDLENYTDFKIKSSFPLKKKKKSLNKKPQPPKGKLQVYIEYKLKNLVRGLTRLQAVQT